MTIQIERSDVDDILFFCVLIFLLAAFIYPFLDCNIQKLFSRSTTSHVIIVLLLIVLVTSLRATTLRQFDLIENVGIVTMLYATVLVLLKIDIVMCLIIAATVVALLLHDTYGDTDQDIAIDEESMDRDRRAYVRTTIVFTGVLFTILYYLYTLTTTVYINRAMTLSQYILATCSGCITVPRQTMERLHQQAYELAKGLPPH